MLRCKGWIWIGLVVVGLAGCGKTDNAESNARTNETTTTRQVAVTIDPNSQTPGDALKQFLEAIRKGNDAKARGMLSSVAREKTSSSNRMVAPSASDTAKFSIGKVEYVGADGARVQSAWSDTDENGQTQTDESLWVLRKEAEGWRIAGVAATVFPNEPPLLLNFEDPEDMAQKQKWAREEILRREKEATSSQAKEPSESGNTLRR